MAEDCPFVKVGEDHWSRSCNGDGECNADLKKSSLSKAVMNPSNEMFELDKTELNEINKVAELSEYQDAIIPIQERVYSITWEPCKCTIIRIE